MAELAPAESWSELASRLYIIAKRAPCYCMVRARAKFPGLCMRCRTIQDFEILKAREPHSSS